MFVKTTLTALALACLASSAAAVGLTPLRKAGRTPSDVKGFYVTVMNPERRIETYDLILYEADMRTPAQDAAVFPHQIRVGARRGRRVMLNFRIPELQRERTVVLCAEPSDATYILARVCGTYTGSRY